MSLQYRNRLSTTPDTLRNGNEDLALKKVKFSSPSKSEQQPQTFIQQHEFNWTEFEGIYDDEDPVTSTAANSTSTPFNMAFINAAGITIPATTMAAEKIKAPTDCFLVDVVEQGSAVHLICKVLSDDKTAWQTATYEVGNITESIYLIPPPTQGEVVHEASKMSADTKSKLHAALTEWRGSARQIVTENKVVIKNTAWLFPKADPQTNQRWCLRIRQSFDQRSPTVKSLLRYGKLEKSGSVVVGSDGSPLESFWFERKLKGPCWLKPPKTLQPTLLPEDVEVFDGDVSSLEVPPLKALAVYPTFDEHGNLQAIYLADNSQIEKPPIIGFSYDVAHEFWMQVKAEDYDVIVFEHERVPEWIIKYTPPNNVYAPRIRSTAPVQWRVHDAFRGRFLCYINKLAVEDQYFQGPDFSIGGLVEKHLKGTAPPDSPSKFVLALYELHKELLELSFHCAQSFCAPWGVVLHKGTVARSEFLLGSHFREANFICPPPNAGLDRETQSPEEPGIIGGKQFPPVAGCHSSFVAILDFTSFYPSLFGFLKACVDPQHPVIPQMMARFIAEREALRQAHPLRAASKKLASNSIWGTLGSCSRFFRESLAKLITTTGRQCIEIASEIAKDFGASVLFGHTDSLGINTNKENPTDANDMVGRMLNAINSRWSGVKMKCEGFFYPMVVWRKNNRLAGRKFLNWDQVCSFPDTELSQFGQHVRGIEMVHRDQPAIIRDLSQLVLTFLFGECGYNEMMAGISNFIQGLVERDVKSWKLYLSLKAKAKEKNPLWSVFLHRLPTPLPDRAEIVFCGTSAKSPIPVMLSEFDPNKNRINLEYYWEELMQGALRQLFDCDCGIDVEVLISELEQATESWRKNPLPKTSAIELEDTCPPPNTEFDNIDEIEWNDLAENLGPQGSRISFPQQLQIKQPESAVSQIQSKKIELEPCQPLQDLFFDCVAGEKLPPVFPNTMFFCGECQTMTMALFPELCCTICDGPLEPVEVVHRLEEQIIKSLKKIKGTTDIALRAKSSIPLWMIKQLPVDHPVYEGLVNRAADELAKISDFRATIRFF